MALFARACLLSWHFQRGILAAIGLQACQANHMCDSSFISTRYRACERASGGRRMVRSAFSGMIRGRKLRLCGESGVMSVQGTEGETTEPPALME